MHSHHNGLKTAALLGLLTALILAVGYWLGGSGGLMFAVIISLAVNAVSYFFSDKIALRAMRARPVNETEFPALHQIVRELATEAGQPMPRLYLSPSMQPNAFATGRNPKNAAVAVTVGITQLLDWRELRGVIGHEPGRVAAHADPPPTGGDHHPAGDQPEPGIPGGLLRCRTDPRSPRAGERA